MLVEIGKQGLQKIDLLRQRKEIVLKIKISTLLNFVQQSIISLFYGS